MIQKHNFYLQFLDHLNAVGVRYAILHDWECVFEGRISDIDIVLDGDELDFLEASLHERYRILTVFHYEWSSFGFVLAPKNCDPAPVLVTDFITDYRWRGRIFFTSEELLRDRQRRSGYWVVGPPQEFGYLLVKKIYEKGSIPEHQRDRLKQLAEELGAEAESVVSILFGKVAGNQLLDWITDERWNRLEAQLPQLRHALRWRIIKRDYLNPLRYWIPEIRRRWQRWRFPTGVSVAVLGLEPPVERRTIEHLKRTLSEAFRRTTVFQGLPGWNALKNGQTTGRMVAEKHPHKAWTSGFQSLTRFIGYVLGFLIRVRPLLVRSTLVLFEVSEDGPLSELLGTRTQRETWIRRLAQRFAPWPNLMLIFDPKATQSSAASQSFSTQDRRLTREEFGARLSNPSARVLLDGRLPAESVAQEAREAVEKYLSRRYLERRHLWFSDAPQTSG